MGNLSISSAARVSASTEDSSAPAATLRQALAPLPEKIDPVTQQPLPPRFPWLSRLSQQLEAAARQRPAFAPAPVLGDHLDKSA